MGWFGSLVSSVGSAISSVASKAVSTISSVAKKIVADPGDFFPFRKDPLTELIGKAINWLFGTKYNSSTASAEETKDINRELAKYAKTFDNEASELEEQALSIANDYFDRFLDQLEELKSQNNLIEHLPIQEIKKDMRALRKQIHGSVKKELSQKYSLDNPDLLAILKMDQNENKERLLQNLSKTIMREAIENLTARIEEVSEKQANIISMLIEEQIDQITQTVRTQNKLLLEIEKAKQSSEEELNATKAGINYTIDLCDLAIKQLTTAK